MPDDVAVARDAAFAALQNAVSHQLLGQGTQQATGLNVYLPTAENARYAADYFQPGVAPQGWAEFVAAFLDALGQPGRPGAGRRAFGSPASRPRCCRPTSPASRSPASSVSGGSSQVTDSETQVYTSIGGLDEALGVVLPGLPRRRR